MSSEELDKSLHSEIENYLGGRLGDVKAELSRLHGQLNEAFSNLLERAFQEETVPSESAIAATIAEHLRAAHERGVELAAEESAKAQAANGIALLKAAIEDIDNQRSQADILSALVNRAASFAPRVAFFVVRNEMAQGWRARGLEGTVGDEAVRQAALLLTDDHAVSEAFRSQSTWSGAPGANAQDHILCNHFGSEPPQHIAALPLTIRNKVVAVLYADSGALDSSAVKLEALEALVRVTGMAVELLAVTRGAPRVAGEAAAHEETSVAVAPEAVAAVAVTAATVAAFTETEESAPEAETVATETEAVAEETFDATEVETETAPEAVAEVEEVAFAPVYETIAAEPEVEAAPEAVAFVEEAAAPVEAVAEEVVAEVETAPEAIVEAAPPEADAVSEAQVEAVQEVAAPEVETETADSYYQPEVVAEAAPAVVVETEAVSFAHEPASVAVSESAPSYTADEGTLSPPYIPAFQPAAFAPIDELETATASFAVPTVEAQVADVMAEVTAPVAETHNYMPSIPAPVEDISFTAPPPPSPDFNEAAEASVVPEPQSYATPVVTEVSTDSASWAMVESATQEAAPEALPVFTPAVAPEDSPAFDLSATMTMEDFAPPTNLIPPAPPAPESYIPIAPAAPETYIPTAPPAPEPFVEAKAEAVATPPNFAPVTTQYTAPLGSARTFGREIELPINVNDDERRLHTDARRFARLLVSEIKLYNEPKVQEGREAGNIYRILRDAIDRSRQMYDRRVAPPVASQFDYFHYELVNTLAEGDAGKLGQEYPGAAI